MNPLFYIAYSLLANFAIAVYDSEGTSFYFNFIRNGDDNPEVPNQKLSITILNGRNNQACVLKLKYKKCYNCDEITASIATDPDSFTEFPIPSFYGWPYDSLYSPQDNRIPHDTLYANSECPLTLLANNYDNVTGKGETFTVLPTTFAGKIFSFTLPPVYLLNQYQQVSFLPVEGSAVVTLKVAGQDNFPPFTVNDTVGTSYIALKSQTQNAAITYQITATAPIMIVAGITCAGQDSTSCDHVAYMPHYLPTSECFEPYQTQDVHLTESDQFQWFADISGECAFAQDIRIFNDDSEETIQVAPHKANKAVKSNTNASMGFEDVSGAVHITKYYDGSSFGKGSYITVIPSLKQISVDDSYFYTRNENDIITVTCGIELCVKLYLDNKILFNTTTLNSHGSVHVGDESFWIISQSVPTKGFHILKAKKPSHSYSFYIHDKEHRYGYSGQVNKPLMKILPVTTATKSTNSTSTTQSPSSSTTLALSSSSTTRPASSSSSTLSPSSSSSTSPSSTTLVPSSSSTTQPVSSSSTTLAPSSSSTAQTVSSSSTTLAPSSSSTAQPVSSSTTTLTPSSSSTTFPSTTIINSLLTTSNAYKLFTLIPILVSFALFNI